MAQYQTLIGTYPVQTGVPDGWIGFGYAPSSHVNIQTVASPYTDRGLTGTHSSEQGSNGAVWESPGSSNSVENLALFKIIGNVSGGNRYTICVARISLTDITYHGSFYATELYYGSTSQLRFYRYSNGSSSLLGSYNYSWVPDTWYWVRTRSENTSQKAKIWPFGSSEPGSWNISVTDNQVAAGGIGVKFDHTSANPIFAVFSGANAGDTAPLPGVYVDASANIVPTLSLGTFTSQKYTNNPVVFSGLSDLRARFSSRWESTAHLVPLSSVGGNLIFALFKWQTWTKLVGESGLTVDAHVIHRHVYEYPGDRYQRRHVDDYAESLSDLLPTGMAWPREQTSVLQRAVKGLAGIWGAEIEDSVDLLLTKEADPRSTTVLLEDWERAWGLPDRCLAEPLTLHDRQEALVDKYTLLGAQDRQFFIDRAAKIGYQIKITEYSPFMAGISECGDTSDIDIPNHNYRWEIGFAEMRFCWTVKVESTRYTWFRAGMGQAGVDHHLELAYATDLECMIRRWKPAHTYVIFDYTPLAAVDLSQMFNTSWLMVLEMM